MRSRRHTAAQSEAVSRRLELLSAELAAVRGVPGDGPDDELPDTVVPDTVVPPGRVTYPATHTQVPIDWLAAAADHTHIPAAPDPEPPDLVYDDPDATTIQIPVPGRHASRRSGSAALPRVLPQTLRGSVRLGPAQLTVVAVLVAVGLAVTGWWLVRGQQPGESVSAAPAPPLTGVPEVTPSSSGATSAAAGATPSGEVVVDVAGKVRRPGIVVLNTGSRVDDAIQAAGGVSRGVDLSSLNLARLLVDGEQILVGMPAPTGAPGAAVPSGGAPDPAGLVNINTAPLAQLDELPGVGPVTGQSIIDWRTANGGFSSVDELLEVDGIGDATLAKLAPHVTI